MDGAVVADDVVVGGAVLGDVQGRERGVLLAQAHQELPQPVRVHLPVHRRARQAAARERDVLGADPARGRGAAGAAGVAVAAGGLRVPADEVVVVVVHAEEVEGRPDGREVTVPDEIAEAEPVQVREGVLGVRAAQDGVQEEAVLQGVEPPGRVEVHRVRGVSGDRVAEVEGDAQVLGTAGPQVLDREAVGQVLVVHGGDGGPGVLPAGRVDPGRVAEQRRAEGLVERGPVPHPVAEHRVHVVGVLEETVRGVPVGPPALLLERLRQVPVVQGQPGQDAGLEQLVDQAGVEVQALGVRGPVTGTHPRPARGEAVGAEPELLHDPHVLGHPVVVLHGVLQGVAVGHGARQTGEGVPDGVLLAALVPGALHLGRGGGRAPEEALGPAAVVHGCVFCVVRH